MPADSHNQRLLVWRERTCWLGFAAMGLSLNVLGPVLPALRTDLHTTYAALSTLLAVSAVGTLTTITIGNRLLDRFGYRTVMAGGAFGYGLALLGAGLSHSLAGWIVAIALTGMGSGLAEVVGPRWVGESMGSRRNAAMNLLNAFYGVGSLVGPLSVAALASLRLPVTHAYLLAALVQFGLGALALRVFAGTRPPQSGVTSALGGWLWALRRPALVRLTGLLALYVGCEVAFADWVASFAHGVDHLDVATAALFPLAFFAALAAGRSLASERARHWSEEAILAAGIAAALLGGGLCLLGRGPATLAVGALATGMGFGPVFPTTLALAARWAPRHQSESFSLLFVGSSAGSLSLPWLAGQMATRFGAFSSLVVPAVGTAGLGGLLAWVARARGDEADPAIDPAAG